MKTPRQLTEKEIQSINPGIRSTVQKLREWGFETCDSGDGETAQFDCDLDCPYVHIMVDAESIASETDRLVGLLVEAGICFDDPPHPQYEPDASSKFPVIEASYLPLQNRAAAIHLFNIVLP